tara:strand:+ start:1363 stop:2739 length:1377 start_codon:yes stop_codon:yes gene_type:complete
MTSTIKVNTVTTESGSTLTLGESGKTVTLASGASQTGFGRTGTVDWQTSSIKTATFTAANGEGYFANTSGGAFTMNLPAGTAGNIVSVVDYTNTFQTNALTIAPNGSQKIGGVAASNALTTEGQSVTFVYVDDTEGWKNVQDSTSNVTGNEFVTATGGTITTCGNDKIHTFTGPGTFAVAQVHPCAANNQVSYLVVAGGGGGGGRHGGGGGAGGFREDKSPVTPYTASPLEGAGTITVTATSFPITVGAGGIAGRYRNTPVINGGQGGTSTFSTISSAGGGGGGTAESGTPCGAAGFAGGSGGGGPHSGPSITGGTGNTPPVSPAQGQNGGTGLSSSPYNAGGGGGATAAGGNAGPAGGVGGAGATTSINGTPTAYSGGGGGGSYIGTFGPGGTGGGGAGAAPGPASSPGAIGVNGTANTGGGGGGTGNMQDGSPSGSAPQIGSTGGSGIVIIRYKFK